MVSNNRVFLAHAREDEAEVRDLYRRLKERGFDPWHDKIDLIPGQLWKDEIPKAIATSGVFLACLSEQSARKQSYVQREFRTALSAYADRPHGSIYLIPVRLDDCEVPDLRISELELGLTDIHWVDLFEEGGFDKLVSAIGLAFFGREPGAEERPSPLPEARAVMTPVKPDAASRLTGQEARAFHPRSAKPPPSPVSTRVQQASGRAGRNPVIIAAMIGTAATVIAAVLGSPLLDRIFGQEWESSQQPVASNKLSDIEPAAGSDQGPRPPSSYRDCPHCPELVMLPAGSFTMGSAVGEEGRDGDEGPQHEVTIGAPFAMGKTEVTFDEYDRFAEATGRRKPQDRGWGRGQRPVIDVSFDDAEAYCGWLGEETGKIYRLPTEAEWEYAARAGTATPFSFGETITPDQVNYNGNDPYGSGKKGVYREKTVPAGSLPANAWGLHEMHGNVWEWVADHHHKNYEGAPDDGNAWLTPSGTKRVLRGGSWLNSARYVRAAHRGANVPGNRLNNLGFRCARVQEEA